jgi:NAD(P)-dependent dehydrogenase (short-subunit alcohol dehydrogenase family)
MTRYVVVTGASTGLGRATALHLAAQGFHVFAGVRDPDALAGSTSDRLRPLVLDVTDEDSVAVAVKTVAAATDTGLWALVNNAGVCVPAPLEYLSRERLRHQLETNVVGSVTVTRHFLPLLRQAGGRIVNVSSGLGRVALPYLGAYAASQFAKEALSDVLRRELRPSGVAVTVVRPGAIMTPIWAKVAAQHELEDAPPEVAHGFRRFLDRSETTAAASRTSQEDFARVVARALTARRPRTRYRVGADAVLASVVSRLLPDTVLDRLLTERKG